MIVTPRGLSTIFTTTPFNDILFKRHLI
jgi:hypothetical protein